MKNLILALMVMAGSTWVTPAFAIEWTCLEGTQFLKITKVDEGTPREAYQIKIGMIYEDLINRVRANELGLHFPPADVTTPMGWIEWSVPSRQCSAYLKDKPQNPKTFFMDCFHYFLGPKQNVEFSAGSLKSDGSFDKIRTETLELRVAFFTRLIAHEILFSVLPKDDRGQPIPTDDVTPAYYLGQIVYASATQTPDKKTIYRLRRNSYGPVYQFKTESGFWTGDVFPTWVSRERCVLN